MVCPFCGKSNHTGYSVCLSCGASNPLHGTPYEGCALISVSGSEAPEEQIYDMGDTTEFEWCITVEGDSPGCSPVRSDVRDLRVRRIGDVAASAWFDTVRTNHDDAAVPDSSGLQLSPEHTLISADPSDTSAHSGVTVCSSATDASTVSAASPSHPSPIPDPHPSDEDLLRTALKDSHEIIRKLGTGGMASVYLARETALDREVAVKLLPQALLRDEQFITRFRREALLSAMLEHPNIVRIYRIGDDPGLLYFIMNYVPGGTLTERIKGRRGQSVRDIVRWSRDICSALAYAHERGVVHRDLKPDNILLDRNDRAIVTDFGIAHAAQGGGLTRTGAVVGTPQYMSPDQACGKTPDARSDIYSLGMVLYQLATGTLPFRADDPVSLMYMHVHTTPDPPERRNPAVPHWMSEIILRCLAKRPHERFQSARDLHYALLEGFHPTEPSRSKSGNESSDTERSSLLETALHAFSFALPGRRAQKSSPDAGRPATEYAPSSRTSHSLKLPRNLSGDSSATVISSSIH